MYNFNIYEFGRMIGDRVRTEAYARALEQTVKPGSIVLDIGTGSGIMAFLACKFGASRVYAVDTNDVIEAAREMAAANGYAHRIEFIQEMSTKINLPERADVMICDIHGELPLYGESLATIIDARRRLLVPGAALIPRRETLWAAVVEAPKVYYKYVSPWQENGFGFDMQAAHRMALNIRTESQVTPEQLLVVPQCWANLDYAVLESPDVEGAITWEVIRPGIAHGLAVWFACDLAPGVGFSNAPGLPELNFHRAYFPWLEPVVLESGDRVSVSLKADLVAGEYLWRWNTVILSKSNPSLVKAEFEQSDFLGKPVSPRRFRKLAGDYLPTLNEDGCIDRFILNSMNGKISLGELTRRVAERFPQSFKGGQEALTRIGRLSEKYSR
jgi:type I protein arginine methyltransferase